MKDKQDIGNLNNAFGVDLDPTNNLSLRKDNEKGQKAFYKNKPMKYMDYISEVGNRIEKNKKGKTLDNIGLFQGVKFDKNGHIIKNKE